MTPLSLFRFVVSSKMSSGATNVPVNRRYIFHNGAALASNFLSSQTPHSSSSWTGETGCSDVLPMPPFFFVWHEGSLSALATISEPHRRVGTKHSGRALFFSFTRIDVDVFCGQIHTYRHKKGTENAACCCDQLSLVPRSGAGKKQKLLSDAKTRNWQTL